MLTILTLFLCLPLLVAGGWVHAGGGRIFGLKKATKAIGYTAMALAGAIFLVPYLYRGLLGFSHCCSYPSCILHGTR